MTKKRERLEVIHDILKAIRDSNNDIKPTKLLHSSNLSPQMFKDYIDELTRKEFIIENGEEGKKSFSLGKKGFEFLEKYQLIKNFIENFGL
jgi:predicted transcriptional regulator